MKVKMKKWYHATLAALLGLLGFDSCIGGGDVPCEYGTPQVEFLVKGSVTDAEGHPLKGIKVTLRESYGVQLYGMDSVYTDRDGKFVTNTLKSISLDNKKIIFEDMDGPENGGEFANDSVDLDHLQKIQTKKGEGWYEGKYEISAERKLIRKEGK